MALRNSGLVAQRLFCGGLLQQTEVNSGKLVWNAALYSSRAAEAGAGEAAAGALPAAVPQYSAAAAAALAAKRANLVPGGSLKPAGMFNMARGFASAVPRAVSAASVEPVATKDPRSALKKLAQAAAALVAALGLTAGTAQADSPEPWAIGFQDTATSTAQAMVDLHHDINFFVICILSLVFYMFFQIVTKFHYSKVLKPEKLTHHTTAEVIWTIVPTLIVVLIAIPSLTLIYSMDQHTDRPGLTVKIIGRQWYWSYEMHDHLQQKLLDPDRLVAIAEKSVLKA